jgi:thioredoxin reductase (NADPH)
MSLNPKPNRAEAVEYYRRVVEKYNLQPRLFEPVEQVMKPADWQSAESSNYKITTSKGTYTARNVIIATGFYDLPVLMDVPGEELPKVSHYYTDPAFYAFQKVLVIGGNNSAVDAALECWRKGAEVTMVLKSSEIGQRVKYWARPDIINRIAEGSITAYFNSTLSAIGEKAVDIKTPEGIITVANDFVLAMTGYQPNFSFLTAMGIELSKDEKLHPVHNPETMETNQPRIYLAGVVCGGMDTHVWFIENSREHAVKIIRDIIAKRTTLST